MKTLTKILSVAVLVALCVCLFTLAASAAEYTLVETYAETNSDCWTRGNFPGFKLSNGVVYQGTTSLTTFTDTDIAGLTPVSGFDALLKDYQHGTLAEKTDPAAGSTCTVPAKHYYECPTCLKHFKDSAGTVEGEETLPLAAHVVDSWVDATTSTCANYGVMKHGVCKNCGQLVDAGLSPTTQEALLLPKSAHSFGAWVTLKDPTNVSPGQQVHTCSVCGEKEYQEIPALGITDGEPIYYVIATRDTWLRGEEPLTFESNLVKKLNDASGPNANYVGVRIGTDSLYENSYDTFDFWSWDQYVKLGEKTMAGLRQGTYRLWIYDRNHPDVYTNSAVFYVVDVPTLEPYSTDKHVVNSSKSLRFIASEEIDPNSVMVGSRKLYDSSDYFVSNDRKSITLSPDFLNARQTGTYTISAVTKDGRTIKTNFYILSTAQASSSPRTGDESQIGLWAAFLLLSGAAIVVMVPKLRKHGAK